MAERVRFGSARGELVGAKMGPAGLGYGILGLAPRWVVTAVQAFADGAILAMLAMLAESMVPEAYHKGGRAVGLATAFGFAVAAILSAVASPG